MISLVLIIYSDHVESWCSFREFSPFIHFDMIRVLFCRKLSIVIIGALGTCLATTVIFAVLFGIERNKSNSLDNEVNQDLCLTPYCIKAGWVLRHQVSQAKFIIRLANYLLESIDETVKPCENFFEFACGTWLKNNRIPDDGKTKGTEWISSEERLFFQLRLMKPLLFYETNWIIMLLVKRNSKENFQFIWEKIFFRHSFIAVARRFEKCSSNCQCSKFVQLLCERNSDRKRRDWWGFINCPSRFCRLANYRRVNMEFSVIWSSNVDD